MDVQGWIWECFLQRLTDSGEREYNENDFMNQENRKMKHTMQLAICDDKPEALGQLATLTREVAAQEGIRCEIAQYGSSLRLLEDIRQGVVWHALLLDAAMDELSGVGLAAALREMGQNTPVILVSDSPGMAPMGYEVSALRYLLKPIDPEKLREALRLCRPDAPQTREIVLPTQRGLRRLPVSGIVYAEAWGRGVRLTLQDGQEYLPLKISELEKLLPGDGFVVCHRTLLVNLACIRYLRYCELELCTGAVLPVSKYRMNDVRSRLCSQPEG